MKRPVSERRQLAAKNPAIQKRIRERIITEVTKMVQKFLVANYHASHLKVRTGVLLKESAENAIVVYDPSLRSLIVKPGGGDYPKRPGKLPININVKRWGAVYRSNKTRSQKIKVKNAVFPAMATSRGTFRTKHLGDGSWVAHAFPPFWQLLPDQLRQITKLQQAILREEQRKEGNSQQTLPVLFKVRK